MGRTSPCLVCVFSVHSPSLSGALGRFLTRPRTGRRHLSGTPSLLFRPRRASVRGLKETGHTLKPSSTFDFGLGFGFTLGLGGDQNGAEESRDLGSQEGQKFWASESRDLEAFGTQGSKH